jgi:transposase
MAIRKTYTSEFKQDALRLVTEQGYNQSEAARNLGIDRGMLGRWIKELAADETQAFRGHGTLISEGENRGPRVKRIRRYFCRPIAFYRALWKR